MSSAASVPSYDHRHGGVFDLGWDRFGACCRQLVERVAADYAPDIVVGIAKGGVLPGVVISSALFVDFFPIKLSSRQNEIIVREVPEMMVPPTAHVAGKNVLLVDDICITMRTMDIAQEALLRAGAKSVRCAAFAIHDAEGRCPEWYGIMTPDLLINPWDKAVFRSGNWSINPEYAAELEKLGVEIAP